MKYESCVRALSGLVPGLTILMTCASAAFARPADVRLVSSSAGTITFEVTVPAPKIVPTGSGEVRVLLEGYGTFSPPGALELPGKTFRTAIPALGEPHVSSSIIEEENIGALHLARVPGERLVPGDRGIPVTEQFYPPDPWQDGAYPSLVSAQTPSFMGRQRILPIRVNPLQIDADGAHLVRRVSITVTFTGAPARVGAGDQAAAPVGGSWKRLYDDLLVNPGDVPALRKPLVPVPALGRPGDSIKRLKIRIPETGLYSLRADSLIAAGLSPGLSTTLIALKQYYYDETRPDLLRVVDVPALFVKDASTAPGVFEGNDRLVFYALGIRDDPDALDPDARYTDDNVVWIEEETAGTAMNAAALTVPIAGDPVTSFRATVKSRKDTSFMKNAVPSTTDFYFIRGPVLKDSSLPFNVPNPAAVGTFSLVLRLQGNDPAGYTHSLSFSIRNSSGTHPLGSGTILGKTAKTFTFSTGAASWLVNGQNELVIVCNTDYVYFVNDLTIEYPALFVARDDMLEFAPPLAVDVQTATIAGFSVNRGFLIDVTNPRAPVYQELVPTDFAPDGNGYRLIINDEGSVARHLIAIGRGAGSTVPVRRIAVDVPSQLRETAGSYNVMAIVHRDFIQRFGEYVAWRTSQGYRIVTADVEDVFDEFNGGLPSPYAIKRFIKYGLNHWGIEFVVLVGDGNEDHKRVKIGDPPDAFGSPPDYVPPYTYSVDVVGVYDDEVVSTDKWYAFVDETLPVESVSGTGAAPEGAAALGGGADVGLQRGYPDVFIGRISVGRDVELRAVLNKLQRFETPAPDDAWRRRVVLFADDAWSKQPEYEFRSIEQEFEWSTDTCRAVIERALPGGFDIKRCYLSHWTDGVHPDRNEKGPTVLSRSIDSTRAYFSPFLIDRLNEGCLFFTFQGHANRSVLTTEQAFESFLEYNDVSKLRTTLPHVFIGIGCHLSDFAHVQELSFAAFDGPNGDCFSEQMLFKPGGGAAATYASDGFEYLNENADLVETIHRALFKNPPADSVEPRNEYTGAHWIFAEAITEGEIEKIDGSFSGLEQVLRYIILGDPLLRIDPGPPLMRLEADWGQGYRPLAPDSFRARGGSNDVKLRLLASDVVAIGKITLNVNGTDWTDSLTVTPLVDAGKTYARSYRADLDYTVDPRDELLVFKVFTPEGQDAGIMEIPIVTTIRLFYSDYLEIKPNVESPPTGTFKLTADFPSYLAYPPVLSIDGLRRDDIRFTVPDPQDSLHWQAVFETTLPSGQRTFTVQAGDFSRDFVFTVTGNELAAAVYSFPNPYRHETNIIYTLNLPIDAGRLEIYDVSGVLIRKIEIPQSELGAASDVQHPHSILWDGRDLAGDSVANGTYIYVLYLEKGGQSLELKGKSVKLE